MTTLTDLAKRAVTRAGSRCSPETIYSLNGIVNYFAVGQWMKAHGFQHVRRFRDKGEIFETAAEQIRDSRVLYLEFGVYEGDSMRRWCRLLRNPSSELHGFDSFLGLPETWSPHRKKGHFSLAGDVPQIDDPRVTFFKGWFEETLPGYIPPPHEELFINVDSDLYSAARTVLRYMKPYIGPGTYIYFDEFHHREHEMKAFDEFLSETGLRFLAVAASPALSQVLFQAAT